jgi:membrane-bound metal-dependent hydrolase YbcI (DUF457 family)
MLGRTHALSGAAACAAGVITAWHPGDAPAAAAAVIFAGAAVLPDIDKLGSTAARSLGFLTGIFASLVSKASGGHRHGTHCLLGIAVFTAVTAAAAALRHTWPGFVLLSLLTAVMLASALRAIGLGGHLPELAAVAGGIAMTRWGYDTAALPLLTALGCVTHIAGDMMTVSGCPLLWPFSQRRFWLVPEQFRTVTVRPGADNGWFYSNADRSWWQLHGERAVYVPALTVVTVILTLDAGMLRPLASGAARLARSQRLRPVITELGRLADRAGLHGGLAVHLAGLAHLVHLAGTVILWVIVVAGLAGLASLAIYGCVLSLRREAAGTPMWHVNLSPTAAADPVAAADSVSAADPAGPFPGPLPGATETPPYEC